MNHFKETLGIVFFVTCSAVFISSLTDSSFAVIAFAYCSSVLIGLLYFIAKKLHEIARVLKIGSDKYKCMHG